MGRSGRVPRTEGHVVQGGAAGFDTGKEEKLSSSQAQPTRQTAWLQISISPFPVLHSALESHFQRWPWVRTRCAPLAGTFWALFPLQFNFGSTPAHPTRFYRCSSGVRLFSALSLVRRSGGGAGRRRRRGQLFVDVCRDDLLAFDGVGRRRRPSGRASASFAAPRDIIYCGQRLSVEGRSDRGKGEGGGPRGHSNRLSSSISQPGQILAPVDLVNFP